MRDWLNSVSEIVILNGADEFHFGEDLIQALAYAYYEKFTPSEAAVSALPQSEPMSGFGPSKHIETSNALLVHIDLFAIIFVCVLHLEIVTQGKIRASISLFM